MRNNARKGAPKKYYDHRTGRMMPTGQGKLLPAGSDAPTPMSRGRRGWFRRIAAAIFGKKR